VINRFMDWLCETGILIVVGASMLFIAGVVSWRSTRYQCVKYETKVKDTYPIYYKIGYMMVPVGGGRKEVTNCVEWKER
jgi:hypothetical protein